MNKFFLILLSAAAVFGFSGCLEIPQGYTEDVDLPGRWGSQRYAVTYSVNYVTDGSSITGNASQTKYIDWLREYMQSSGAYSSVTYKPFEQKSNYHVHYLIHYSNMSENQADAMENLMECTLFVIPMWINMYLDTSAILYLNGKPVYSPAASDALRSYIWLPFLPVSMVWNRWWAWTTLEKKCCRYLVNELVTYQKNNL